MTYPGTDQLLSPITVSLGWVYGICMNLVSGDVYKCGAGHSNIPFHSSPSLLHTKMVTVAIAGAGSVDTHNPRPPLREATHRRGSLPQFLTTPHRPRRHRKIRRLHFSVLAGLRPLRCAHCNQLPLHDRPQHDSLRTTKPPHRLPIRGRNPVRTLRVHIRQSREHHDGLVCG